MTDGHEDGYGLLGASVPQQVNANVGGPTPLANGPMVFTGASLVNTGAAPATVTFSDGSAETVGVVVLAAGASGEIQVPDKGTVVTTQLNITVAGSGPVSGCAYTKQPRDYVRERESWQPKSDHSTSPSQPGQQ